MKKWDKMEVQKKNKKNSDSVKKQKFTESRSQMCGWVSWAASDNT